MLINPRGKLISPVARLPPLEPPFCLPLLLHVSRDVLPILCEQHLAGNEQSYSCTLLQANLCGIAGGKAQQLMVGGLGNHY